MAVLPSPGIIPARCVEPECLRAATRGGRGGMEDLALTGAGALDVVISPSAAANINTTMTQPRGSTVLGLSAVVGSPVGATQAVEYPGAVTSDAAKK